MTALPSYIRNYVYIADNCGPAVDILANGNYAELGFFTSGLSVPGDIFVDAKRNIYVSNYGNATVTEYSPAASLLFTYSKNMSQPWSVTTDARGNVYEGDAGNGSVNEYFQQRNTNTVSSCQPDTQEAIYGIGVDSGQNVFVDVDDYNLNEEILFEYPGGLGNCGNVIQLLVVTEGLTFSGSIAVDKSGNLLIADGRPYIQLVNAPSHNVVNGSIGSFRCATNVRLNKANTQAFVTDSCANTVTVMNYPSGTTAAVLGTGNGISEPTAAVESANAVY